MNYKNIHQSKIVRGILIGIAIMVVALIIFQAGQVTGYRKARFAGNFGSNFERNFVGPKGGNMMVGGGFGMMTPSGHGAVGEILSISLPQIIVLGEDNLEKVVIVAEYTDVHQFRENLSVSDLKIGDRVVILGNPNENGQIEAKLIRIMPKPNK